MKTATVGAYLDPGLRRDDVVWSYVSAIVTDPFNRKW